ncbi:MAG: cobyric acid synthase [Vicinamibacterales bacterium]
MSARPLFIGGTSSNSGKSWMTTAICAWLRARGVRVAPFKAQNMSNHSYPCVGGGEIGRSQVAQAEACGLEPEAAMNPILLKPHGNGTSQVILHGRVWKTLTAREYYAEHEMLMREVLAAYQDLARRFDRIIIEGAGSVSELNLRPFDVVNLGLVTALQAPWVLVSDIERGGAIAAVVGTVALLTAEERRLFRGFLVNKFRGDRSLFDQGRQIIEEKTGTPCLGVFPADEDIHLDAEDSLAVVNGPRQPAPLGARIGIVRLPRMSNATDFRLLDWAEWIETSTDRRFDFVILPGTKDTLGDLEWLRGRGLDRWVIDQHAKGATVIGVCGGYQMLGTSVSDPLAMESVAGRSAGLGLLPVHTVLAAEKVTTRRRGHTRGGAEFEAYEIHLGVTDTPASLRPFATLDGGRPEGVVRERVIGTYLHGLFESAAVCSEVFGVAVTPPRSKADDYVALGEWFGRHAERVEDWLALS